MHSKYRFQHHSPDAATGRRRRRRQQGQGSEQGGTNAGHLLRPISNCSCRSRVTALFFHCRELCCSSGALPPLLISTALPKLPEIVLFVHSSPAALLKLFRSSSTPLLSPHGPLARVPLLVRRPRDFQMSLSSEWRSHLFSEVSPADTVCSRPSVLSC